MTAPTVGTGRARRLLTAADFDNLHEGQGFVFHVPSGIENGSPLEVGHFFYLWGFGVLYDARGNLVGRYSTPAEGFEAVAAFFGFYTCPVTAVRSFTGIGTKPEGV